MSQRSENVGCQILGEFVDDAGRARAEPKRYEERYKTEWLKELVRRIAKEMNVPQFELAEVVAKASAAVDAEIEKCVRDALSGQQ